MISVVIPSYNRKDCVLALLADVYRQEGVEFEVIVVDDCSPDGSYEAIAERFPEVILLKYEKNGGPCVTRNRGVLAAKGDIVVGFDSDVTVPDTRLLEKTAKTFSQHPEATGLSFRLLKPDGKSEDIERWWHPLPIESFADAFFETPYFSGTGYAFRRKEMIQAGLYPEVLYMHYEEVILAYRVIDEGGAIFHAPALHVLHHAAPTQRRSRIKTFFKTRNQIVLAYECLPFIRAVIYLAPRLAYNLAASVAGGYFTDYAGALRSALEICGSGRSKRKPLRAETLRRISMLSRTFPQSQKQQSHPSPQPSL